MYNGTMLCRGGVTVDECSNSCWWFGIFQIISELLLDLLSSGRRHMSQLQLLQLLSSLMFPLFPAPPLCLSPPRGAAPQIPSARRPHHFKYHNTGSSATLTGVVDTGTPIYYWRPVFLVVFVSWRMSLHLLPADFHTSGSENVFTLDVVLTWAILPVL